MQAYKLHYGVLPCLTLEDSNLSIPLIAFFLNPATVNGIQMSDVSPQFICLYLKHETVYASHQKFHLVTTLAGITDHNKTDTCEALLHLIFLCLMSAVVKLPLKGVSSKIWHILCADRLINCIEELQVGLLERILQEFVINEIVHPFKDCDSASFIQCRLHFSVHHSYKCRL